jgi:hypothetical protein
MGPTIGDGRDDERRPPLPESVDRVLGQVVERRGDGRIVLNQPALDALAEYLKSTPKDSNLDRIPIGPDIDILIDGNVAVAALVVALTVRLENPVAHGETLILVPPIFR